MASSGAGTVWLSGWLGLFSAQGGGGAGVYANRPEPQDWETWTLIDNGDGTVSFKTINGHFLCAEEGGGRECQANRTQIGVGKVCHRTIAQRPDCIESTERPIRQRPILVRDA